jgi:hypothetical protein
MLAHPGHVNEVAFSGSTLVSAGGDGTIKAWNVARGVLTGRVVCRAATGLRAARDGTLYEGCGMHVRRVAPDGTVRVLPVRGAPMLLAEHDRVLWTSGETMHRFDLRSGTVTATYGPAVAGAFTHDGRRVEVARGDDEIVVRDLAANRRMLLRGFAVPANAESFSHTGLRLVFDPSDTRDTIWRVAANAGIVDRWVLDYRRPRFCEMGDGFRFAVPLAVRGGDDVAIPAGTRSNDVTERAQRKAATKLWNVATRTATVSFERSTDSPAIAFDAPQYAFTLYRTRDARAVAQARRGTPARSRRARRRAGRRRHRSRRRSVGIAVIRGRSRACAACSSSPSTS